MSVKLGKNFTLQNCSPYLGLPVFSCLALPYLHCVLALNKSLMLVLVVKLPRLVLHSSWKLMEHQSQFKNLCSPMRSLCESHCGRVIAGTFSPSSSAEMKLLARTVIS